ASPALPGRARPPAWQHASRRLISLTILIFYYRPYVLPHAILFPGGVVATFPVQVATRKGDQSMQKVTAYPNGIFCWVDLSTSDFEGAKAFYSQLFGWEADDPPPDGPRYANFRL